MSIAGLDRTKEEKQKIIESIYDKMHGWLQHYNGLIVQINSLAIGGSSAIIAFFVSTRWSTNKPPAELSILLLAPLLISGFAIWSTYVIVQEMHAAFGRVIRIERYWQMYDKNGLLPDEPIFSDKYMNSDRALPPIPKHFIIAQAIVAFLTIFVAGLSFAR